MKTIKSLLLLALLSVISSQLMAQEMVASELPPSVEHQLFGSSIAISAEWALVGAPPVSYTHLTLPTNREV